MYQISSPFIICFPHHPLSNTLPVPIPSLIRALHHLLAFPRTYPAPTRTRLGKYSRRSFPFLPCYQMRTTATPVTQSFPQPRFYSVLFLSSLRSLNLHCLWHPFPPSLLLDLSHPSLPHSPSTAAISSSGFRLVSVH